jgi:catechol 2,3-dioxygenase-like lactoylglutathione lyase family enzyme
VIDVNNSAAGTIASPAPFGFRGISVPVRNIEEAKQFYLGVLGGDLVHDGEDYAEVVFGSFVIGLGKQDKGATLPEMEYPHYAFTVASDQFMGAKQRLDSLGIPTHEPWTREGSTCALMYFRDPSGNQFELYCDPWEGSAPLRVGARAGGDYVVPFASLNYGALPQAARQAPRAPRHLGAGFNHMTLPVRDMQEGKRFLVAALGGEVKFERPTHTTVYVGGAEFGQAPVKEGWTLPDCEYPRYTLLARAEDLVPLKKRIEALDVPTSAIWTRDGSDASLYLRDPSGNLLELYSESGFRDASHEKPDVRTLNYASWSDPGK